MNHFPLEPIEKASVDELRALQLKRLQATLRHAYQNSPVYRRKFDEAGVHPDDCRTLADLSKFPFTTKKDLRDSYPRMWKLYVFTSLEDLQQRRELQRLCLDALPDGCRNALVL